MNNWKEKLIKEAVERELKSDVDLHQDIEIIKRVSDFLLKEVSPIIEADITICTNENAMYENKEIVRILLDNGFMIEVFASEKLILVNFGIHAGPNYCNTQGFAQYLIREENGYQEAFTVGGINPHWEKIQNSTINYIYVMERLFGMALEHYI